MKVNNKLIGMFTGAAMALGAAVSPALAADGQASYFDARKFDSNTQEVSGAFLSSKHDAISLVVKGVDEAILSAIYTASGQVEAEHNKDVIFVHVTDTKPNDGITEIEVYVDGVKTGKLSLQSSENAELKLAAVVDDGIKRVDVSALDAQITPENG